MEEQGECTIEIPKWMEDLWKGLGWRKNVDGHLEMVGNFDILVLVGFSSKRCFGVIFEFSIFWFLLSNCGRFSSIKKSYLIKTVGIRGYFLNRNVCAIVCKVLLDYNWHLIYTPEN